VTSDRRDDRRSAVAREAGRKAIHVTSAIVPIALALGVARMVVATILAALFLIALAVEVSRRASPAAAGRFNRLFAPLLREHERYAITGATWLIGAMLIAVALLARNAAIVATWAVAIGDATAALIGIRFGRRRAPGSGKSLEGSVACAATTIVGALLLAHMTLFESMVLGISAALAERATWPRDDNVRIVVVVGVSAWLLTRVLY
jgi:dolichol kinase